MPAFPAPIDFGRPVPRPSGYVPNVPAAQQSGADAEATMAIAGQFKELGQEVEQASARIDTTMAQDALNKFREARDDLSYGEKGFMRLKGGEVLKPGAGGKSIIDEYPASLQQRTDAILSTAGLSPRARQLFDAKVAQEQSAYKLSLTRHSIEQSEVHAASVFKDTLAGITRRGVAASDDPNALDKAAEDAYSVTLKRAADRGIEGTEMAVAARSEVYKLAIAKRIAENDPSAVAYFERYKDKLDDKDRIGLQQSVKTLALGVEAQSWVNIRIAGGSAAPGALHAAIVTQESGGRQYDAKGNVLTSIDNAKGIGQITEGTFKQYAKPGERIDNKEDNFRVSRRIIDDLHARFGGDPARVAVGYFSGPGNVAPAGSPTPWRADLKDGNGKATSSYVADVQKRLASAGPSVAQGAGEQPRSSDPLQNAVDGATGVPDAAPQRAHSDGIVDARRQMIAIEQQKVDLTARNLAENGGNLLLMQKVQGVIDAQFTQGKARVQLYKDQLYASVQDWMSKGGPNGGPAVTMPPANILSQMTWEQQQSIERQVNRNIEGKKTKTNQEVWYNIHAGLTSGNANERETWASVPLFQFKEHLSDQDFQELAKAQAAVRKGDDKHLTRVQGITSQLNGDLLNMGIDPTPKPGTSDAKKAADYHRAFQNELTVFEEGKGSKASEKEIQGIRDGLMKKLAGTGGWFSSDKRVMEIEAKDVPEADRLQIISAIRKQGGVPTDERVLEVYRHKLVTAPRETEIPRPLEPPMLGLPGGGAASSSRSVNPVAAGFPVRASTPAPLRVVDNPPEDITGKMSTPLAPLNSFDNTARALRIRLGLD